MVHARPSLAGGLHWIRGELDQSLSRARALIEQYLDSPEDQLPLQQAAVELHQVRGTAAMIQCAGVATLAEEMKRTLQELMQGQVQDSDNTISTLLGACVQLGDYIDALSSGVEDCVLTFAPVINELRVSRGSAVISEAELLAGYLRAQGVVLALPDDEARDERKARAAARKFLPKFQASLLAWLKGSDRELALERMGKIAELLATTATRPQAHQLWRSLAALVESLLDGEVSEQLELKRLFGRIGQQLKLQADAGEASVEDGLGDLPYQMLFALGRTANRGPRTAQLCDELALDSWLPSEQRVLELRSRIGGPNTVLLVRLADEIRVDFADVKDSIDLFVRAGTRAPADLGTVIERLQRMSNTLSMLGLNALQQVVGNQIADIRAIQDSPEPVDAGRWMDVATSLLRVEHSLDGALFHQLHNPAGQRALEPEREYEDAVPHTADHRDSVEALLRESLVDLAKLKSHVDNFLKSGDAEGLDEAGALLAEVQSGLDMLQSARAAELVGRMAAYARSDTFRQLSSDPGQAERFAMAVACVEYYLEGRQRRQPDADRILDDLAGYVEQLQVAPGDERPVQEPAAQAAPVADAPAGDDAVDEVDPEIREIFLEEAGEVIEELRKQLPALKRSPGDSMALTEIRRAFHTLKGSGRMVGATSIGEFGWALENLLNRCLDGSRDPDSEVVETVEEAVEALPELVGAFRDAEAPGERIGRIVARAERLVSGENEAVESDVVEAFVVDASGQLETIAAWPGEDGRPVPSADLIRAFHTLRGSASIVGEARIAAIAAEAEQFLEAAMSIGRALDEAALAVVRDSHDSVRGWLGQVPFVPDGDAKDALPLLARFREQLEALPAEARDAAANRDLRGVFAHEALDLLQSAEAAVGRWAAQPESEAARNHLMQTVQGLQAAASTADCEPIHGAAGALVQLLRDLPQPPADVGLFDALQGVCESLNQLLDAYHEGSLRDDDGELSARIRGLADDATGFAAPADDAGIPSMATVAVAPAEPVATADDDDTPDPELLAIFQAEAEELLEELDRQFDAWERQPEASEPPEEIARALHTLKGSARMAGQYGIGDVGHTMEELLGGVGTGRVLVDSSLFSRMHNVIDGLYQAVDSLKRGVQVDTAPLMAELQADAGAPAATDTAAEPPAPVEEQAVQGIELDAGAGEAAVVTATDDDGFDLTADDSLVSLESLEQDAVGPATADEAPPGVEGLELEDDQAVAGADGGPAWPEADADAVLPPDDGVSNLSVPDQGLMPEAVEADASGLEAGELSVESDDIAVPPVAEDEPVPDDDTAAVAPTDAEGLEVVEAAEDEDADGAASDFDPELADIFSGEAAELLEQLDSSLNRWSSEPADIAAMQEIQRALHTLKGGARMAGLQRMGSRAHDMETRVNRIEAGMDAADAEAWAALAGDLEQLHQMHDQLVRGDAADLLSEPEPDELSLAAEDLPPAAPASDPDDGDPIEPADEDLAIEADDAAPAAATSQDGGAEAEEPASETEAESPWGGNLFWNRDSGASLGTLRRETARVPVDALDGLLNQAGEISIFRSRLEQHTTGLQFQLNEMHQTIDRVRDQLRQVELETEAQIEARGLAGTDAVSQHPDRYEGEFDPLEMDRYSRMQELSRALSESINDLNSLHASMDEVIDESEGLLQQQGRVNTEVQQGLMRTLMVPFARQVQRLQRVVRQVADESGKRAQLEFSGVEAELDRNVLERMTAPLEHLLRNAVVHGIESPEQRAASGKSETGRIEVQLTREGPQLVIELRDDGRGLDIDAIRAKAIERGLMPADAEVDERSVAQFIFEPGFSTAREVTQVAGRGVGMDVVAAEVKQLGGTLELGSEQGRGTRFVIRLPLTLAISQALLVNVGSENYAIPLSGIDGIGRIPVADLPAYFADEEKPFEYGGQPHRVAYLGDFLDLPRPDDFDTRTVPVVLLRIGEGLGRGVRRVAIVVDGTLGNREIVSKAVGPQVSSVLGISGATILADGSVVLILDVPALVQDQKRRKLMAEAAGQDGAQLADDRELIMVVDDSITMRRVAERLLNRNGYRVITAKDGLDAIAQLHTESPRAILLDIEMPRADGFEVATFVRNNERIAEVPIIMITSRSGDKHRERAAQIGVNKYLIKPYQEEQLLNEVRAVTDAETAGVAD